MGVHVNGIYAVCERPRPTLFEICGGPWVIICLVPLILNEKLYCSFENGP